LLKKLTSKDAALGREQAKEYCLNIEQETGVLTFCFYANDHQTFFGI
jgi:type I restriction enzyme R subunit